MPEQRDEAYELVVAQQQSEIESLRAQLAEVTRERNAFRRQYSAECDNHYCTKEQLAEVTRERNELRELSVTNIMVAICPGGDGMGEEVYARSLDDVFAVINRLSEKAEDADSFRVQLLATQAQAARLVEAVLHMCHNTVAEDGYDHALVGKALSTPINLDALHEDRARECERLKKGLLNDNAIDWLTQEAAAHRAKKEAV